LYDFSPTALNNNLIPNFVYGINQFMNIVVAEAHAKKYERLRYVTENFQFLQGLTSVWVGGVMVFLGAQDVPGVVFPWWLALLGMGFCLATIRYLPDIDKYYEQRFGSVESRVGPPNALFPIVVLVLLVMFLVIIFFGPVVGRYLDSIILQISNEAHRMIFDPDHRANLSPALWLFVFLYPGVSRRTSGLQRLRTFFYCASLLLWTGVLTLLPLQHPEVTQQTLWKILNACWFGITLMLFGLYDHLALILLLPKRDQSNDDE
jgi:hypothetical protein